ncbi:MAG: hypothetical protein J6D03_03400 [Clostridia bacterium]|nr:hypothetical protein [Clostridia bacterium]HBC85224.1 hypothetical protein [Clostridiales bacterium]
MLLSNLCKPLDIFKVKNNQTGKTYASQGIRTALFILMIVIFGIGITIFKDWFSITITYDVIPLILVLCMIAFGVFIVLSLIFKKLFKIKV